MTTTIGKPEFQSDKDYCETMLLPVKSETFPGYTTYVAQLLENEGYTHKVKTPIREYISAVNNLRIYQRQIANAINRVIGWYKEGTLDFHIELPKEAA